MGMAELVATGQATASELVEAAIARIEEVDPHVNAVVASRFEEALEEAGAALHPGPLSGVPFLLKDLHVEVAGLPATQGSRLLADHRPQQDNSLVARYRAAGLVILGLTNTPEFGRNASTEPLLHGPTRNPRRLTHSAGGSSGGSAASVAAGMVPAAHGNDGGGSIRIPASMCGVFGLKPTRGRVPAPQRSAFAYPIGLDHVLTLSVRDSAALLDAVAKPLPGDPYPPPHHPGTFRATVDEPPGRLRIAFTTTTALGRAAHPDVAAAVRRAAELCEDLGHVVEEAAPSFDAERGQQAWNAILFAPVVQTVDRRLADLDRDLTDEDIEPFTRLIYEQFRSMSAAAFIEALEGIERAGREVAAFFGEYDLLLTPSIAEPVPPLGLLDTRRPESIIEHGGAFVEFTALFNATGQPAMSVPFGTDGEGLPTSVHFAGRYGEEGTLFRLAAQLEEASPWAGEARLTEGVVGGE